VIADGRKKGDEVRWRFLMTAEGDFASGQLSRAKLIRITEALERRP
jgi:hypothetical protein